MRILKFFLRATLLLLVVFFIGGFLIAPEWTVTRSLAMHATPETIYPLISNFKAWEKWSPWNASKDATLQYTYQGAAVGVGAKQSWTSEKMGSGWMQFTTATPQTGVAYDLFIDMGRSQSTMHGTIYFMPAGDTTTVTWTDKGDSGKSFIKRWMSLLIKPMLGKEFDSGLAQLKTLVEKK